VRGLTVAEPRVSARTCSGRMSGQGKEERARGHRDLDVPSATARSTGWNSMVHC
jgi:hypothetical protein